MSSFDLNRNSMITTDYTIVRLKDNYGLLPETSYFRKYCKEDEENPVNILVLVKGDFEIDNLSLDYIDIKDLFFVKEGFPAVLVIAGNLTVNGNISNVNTDGAVMLYVDLNLSAQNVIVGGQEIIIGGNCDVKGLFWGDYNHGTCAIGGSFLATTLLLTDGYDFSVTGPKKCIYSVTGSVDDHWVENVLLEEFPASFFEYDREDKWIFLSFKERKRLFEELNNNPSLAESLAVPPVFPDKTLSYRNALRLTDSVFAQNPDREYLFHIDDTSFYISVSMDDKYRFEYSSVIITLDDVQFGITAYVGSDELFTAKTIVLNWLRDPFKKKGPIKNLKGRPEERIAIHYKLSPNDDNSEFIRLEDNSDQYLHDIFKEKWDLLLENIPVYEHYWQKLMSLIDVRTIKAILDLPFTYAYPYFDDDNSFWLGNLGMAFRHEGDARTGGLQYCARVSFNLEAEKDEVEKDYEQFLFDIDDYGTETEKMTFRYYTNSMYDNDEEPRKVDLHEVEHVRKATALLKRFYFYVNNNLYPDIFGKWENGRLIAPPDSDFYLPSDKENILARYYRELKEIIAGRCITGRRKAWLCFAFMPGNEDAYLNLFYQIESGHIVSAYMDDDISQELFTAVSNIADVENKRKTPWTNRIFYVSDCDIGYIAWDADITDEKSYDEEISKWKEGIFSGFEVMAEQTISNMEEINGPVNHRRQHLYTEGVDTVDPSEENRIAISKEVLPGTLVNVMIDCDKDSFLSDPARYDGPYRWLVENEPKARQCVAEKLCEFFKDVWDDDEEVPEEDLFQRIYLSGGTINDNGMALHYCDADMFSERTITVHLDKENNLVRADIGPISENKPGFIF